MVHSVAGKVANKVIAYAFTAGVIIAVILGLISTRLAPGTVAVLTSILILAGILVGFFNITGAEQRDYIIFATALVIVTSQSKGSLGALQIVGPYLESVLGAMMAFIVPSVIIVGLRAIIGLAKD